MSKKNPKIFFYSSDDLKIIQVYRLEKRVLSVNSRFEDKISLNILLEVLKRNNLKCFYCYEKLPSAHWQLDHFYARCRGGKNVSENLVSTCRWCNTMKRELDGFSFINKCQNIIDNNFFKRNNLPLYIDTEEEKRLKTKEKELKKQYVRTKINEHLAKKGIIRDN